MAPPKRPDHRPAALRFVVLIGVVSLFADATYEGARSVTGPFLGGLGASAAVVGIVAGLGELLGYTPRLASGYLADRTRRYWTFTVGLVAARASYRDAFGVLAVPAVLAIGVLLAARALYPTPQDLEIETPRLASGGLRGAVRHRDGC